MAVKHRDGSVSLTLNGSVVKLSAADLSSIEAAEVESVAVSPITIVTGKGRTYGTPESPRFGIFYDSEDGSFHWLDEDMSYIPNGSWRPRNLNKAKLTFTKPN
jgi:hypothetical protein